MILTGTRNKKKQKSIIIEKITKSNYEFTFCILLQAPKGCAS